MSAAHSSRTRLPSLTTSRLKRRRQVLRALLRAALVEAAVVRARAHRLRRACWPTGAWSACPRGRWCHAAGTSALDISRSRRSISGHRNKDRPIAPTSPATAWRKKIRARRCRSRSSRLSTTSIRPLPSSGSHGSGKPFSTGNRRSRRPDSRMPSSRWILRPTIQIGRRKIFATP